MPRLNSDGPRKSETSNFKNMRLFNFQAFDPKFVLALELRVLKLKGSSLEIRLKGFYKKNPKKVAITAVLGAKVFLLANIKNGPTGAVVRVSPSYNVMHQL